MRRHRSSAPPPDSFSSSDDDDAFSAFSSKKSKRKQKKKDTKHNPKQASSKNTTNVNAKTPTKSNISSNTSSNTSSNANSNNSSIKRHHGTSSARQAKMDALLLELENEKKQANTNNTNPDATTGHYSAGDGNAISNSMMGTQSSSLSSLLLARPPPDKRGSFVEEGEEHLTTNIFVGNLAPSVTEEALTDLFRQFGDLYSVKIMWPRTAEERARNRNTGFVCFMTREDAQEAMDAYNEEEVFGRRMVLRWGKNVKKTVKRGTGGVPIPPIKKKTSTSDNNTMMNLEGGNDIHRQIESNATTHETNGNHYEHSIMSPSMSSSNADLHHNSIQKRNLSSSSSDDVHKLQTPPYPIYDPLKDSLNSIHVIPPTNPFRLQFITTVASFVAKDGSLLEKKIIERESANPLFSFLDNDTDSCISNAKWETLKVEEQEKINERVFYRWRVFSFTQGDGFNSWRTDPFVMFYPNGRWWIPPPLNYEAAQREEELAKKKEDDIIKKMEERRRISNKKDFMTGRQLEHAKFGNVPRTGNDGGGVKLNDWEKEQFDNLSKKKLCASRESICEAMSFCFDKSGAAVEIADLLKQSLLQDGPEISVDTRIARLFLLSDVLFNSQQPGVRNAFRYRDAIETMAPDVFMSMGKHGNGKAGRMTMNKLRQAVNSVLNAWTNWSVYNSIFIDELQMKFEGKEVVKKIEEAKDNDEIEDNKDVSSTLHETNEITPLNDIEFVNPMKRQKVHWKPVEDDHPPDDDVDGEQLEDDELNDCKTLETSVDVDGELIDDELDGEPVDEDELDIEPLSDGELDTFVKMFEDMETHQNNTVPIESH